MTHLASQQNKSVEQTSCEGGGGELSRNEAWRWQSVWMGREYPEWILKTEGSHVFFPLSVPAQTKSYKVCKVGVGNFLAVREPQGQVLAQGQVKTCQQGNQVIYCLLGNHQDSRWQRLRGVFGLFIVKFCNFFYYMQQDDEERGMETVHSLVSVLKRNCVGTCSPLNKSLKQINVLTWSLLKNSRSKIILSK